MANPQHLQILNKGVKSWNLWREENPTIKPDLSEADLTKIELRGANLSEANLSSVNLSGIVLSEHLFSRANFSETDLSEANLSRSTLRYTNFSRATLYKANLAGADLSNAWLSRAYLQIADLSKANLSGAKFSEADLQDAKLEDADLTDADLSEADLSRTYLKGAKLPGANLSKATLFHTNFSGADLSRSKLFLVYLSDVNLSGANLSRASLLRTVFLKTKLEGADFTECLLDASSFNDTDLSEVKGLAAVIPYNSGCSTIGIDTLYKSKGKIPEAFLKACGVPEGFIIDLPFLTEAKQAIQPYSYFINYSSQDEMFANRLCSRMRDAHLRARFALQEQEKSQIKDEQIRGGQIQDRWLLVLSNSSMQSEWVAIKLRSILKEEKREGRRKLFPIKLADLDKIKDWSLVEEAIGMDSVVKLRSYDMPDFSNWKDFDAFEAAFKHLLKFIRAEAK